MTDVLNDVLLDVGWIPLESVCDSLLSLSVAQANRQAAAKELPFPVVRAGSQKSKWYVSKRAIADYMASLEKQAKKDLQLKSA